MQQNSGNILATVGAPGHRDDLTSVLAKAGSAVHVAVSLADAVVQFSRAQVDIALVDLSDTFEDLARIASEAERSGATLLTLGDPESPDDLLLSMRLGARDCLSRNLEDGEHLTFAVRRWLIARETSRPTGGLAEENRRLRHQHEELRRHFAEQVRSHEDTQEAFYLDLSRMMTIIGNIMDGIVFVDQHGSIALMNPVAEDLLGVKSFIAIGKQVTDLTGRRELTKALQEDHRLVVDRKEVVRTIEIHHSEQDLIYIKSQTTKVLDYRGVEAGVLTVLQDVTSEFKSDQLKNQYLSIVAHELRTPLTGIKTFSTVMSKGALGELNGKQREVMDAIREQSVRLEHQIDKLINLGQIDSNSFGQDVEEFDAVEFAQQACAPFEQAAKDRGIEFSLGLPAYSVLVRADRTDLRRALQALIENAVKFTPDHGHVEVRLNDAGHEATFMVADGGIGIDPRYHRRIFEKFFQVEDPLTRHHGGAGLGLFVARGIIEAHVGRIDVSSELGKGAVFSFRITTVRVADTGSGACEALPITVTKGSGEWNDQS